MTDPRYMRPGLPFAVGKAIEEAGELQAALGKTLRWGWDSFNPELPPQQQETNSEWVLREIADLRGALDNLEKEMFKDGWSPKRLDHTCDRHRQMREIESPETCAECARQMRLRVRLSNQPVTEKGGAK